MMPGKREEEGEKLMRIFELEAIILLLSFSISKK